MWCLYYSAFGGKEHLGINNEQLTMKKIIGFYIIIMQLAIATFTYSQNIKDDYFDKINFEKLEYARKNNIIDPIFYISYNNLPFSDIITAIDHFNIVGIYDDNIIPHKSIISSYHIVNTKFIGGTIYWARYNILFNWVCQYYF